MNTDDLINQMSSHLRPIKPQSSPRVFSFQFFLFSLLVIGLGLGIFHFRSDLKELLSNYLFLIELLFSLSLMVSGFLLIAWMTSPGRQYGVRYKMGTSFTFFTLLTLNCYRLSLSSIPFTKSPVLAIDLKCFVMVLAYSLIISVALFFIVKKRVVTAPSIVGAMIGLTSVASGMMAISLHCANLGPIHISIYHFLLPVLTSSAVGATSGKYFLRW